MKKLMAILGTVILTTTASASLVACRGTTNKDTDDYKGPTDTNGNLVTDRLVLSALNATGSVSKAGLLTRHENINLGRAGTLITPYDYLGLTANLSFNSSVPTTYGSGELRGLNQDYLTWFTANWDYSTPTYTKDMRKFMDSTALNGGNLYWANGENYNNAYFINNPPTDEKVSTTAKLADYHNVISAGTSQLGALLTNFDSSQRNAALGLISNFLSISKTNTGILNPSDDTKGVGMLRQLWVGDPKSIVAAHTISDSGKKIVTGHIIGIFNAMYRAFQQDPTLAPQLFSASDITTMMGTLGPTALVTDENSAITNNTGLYGQAVADMLDIQNHYHTKADPEDGNYFKHTQPQAWDDSVKKALKDQLNLLDMTLKSIGDDDTKKQLFVDTLVNSEAKKILNYIISILLPSANIESFDWITFLEGMEDFLKVLLNYNGTGEFLDDNSYSFELLNNLESAKAVNANWWSSENQSQYAPLVHKAFGYDPQTTTNVDKGGFIIGSAYDLIYQWSHDENNAMHKLLFSVLGDLNETIKTATYDLATNFYDYWVNDKKPDNSPLWKYTNVAWKKSADGNTITDLSFDIEYKGVGDPTGNNHSAGTPVDLNKLQNDPDYQRLWNGDGEFKNLVNVDHLYHLVWTNTSTDVAKPNLIWTDLTSFKVFENGTWVNKEI